MRLNANKIEGRIKKLQEIQRIAADPEMLRMLFEFIDADEESAGPPQLVTTKQEEPVNLMPPEPDEAGDLITGVMSAVSPSGKRLRV